MEIRGLDLSSWNRGINFDTIINDGYKFVILRGSFTWKYNGESPEKDNEFDNFYTKAKAKGLGVGVYHYSCANTASEGENEAKFLYENCLKGRQFEYPIYIDVEDEQYQGSDKKGTTDAIIAFCEYLENLGYYVGIYASNYWFIGRIDTNRLSSYDKWLAFWTQNKPIFAYGKYGMWQNSSSGNVGGIRVDTNYCYQDYPQIMINNKLNGFKSGEVKKPVEEPKKEEPSKFKLGERVFLKENATVYKGASDGVVIPKSIKGKNYTVKQLGNKIILLKEINSWVNESDCDSLNDTQDIRVGDKVIVTNPINYDTNKAFKVYYPLYDVIEVSGERVVIGIGSTVTSAIHISLIKKQ